MGYEGRVLLNKSVPTSLELLNNKKCKVEFIEVYGCAGDNKQGGLNSIKIVFFDEIGGAVLESLNFIRPAEYKQIRLEPVKKDFKLKYNYCSIASDIKNVLTSEDIYLIFDPPIIVKN